MNNSSRLQLPLIQPAQAQKHVTHNEALKRLDSLVQMNVISRTIGTPPENAAHDSRYVIGDSPSGEWKGKKDQMAIRNGQIWEYFQPNNGWIAWCEEERAVLVYDRDRWIRAIDDKPQPIYPPSYSFKNLTLRHQITPGRYQELALAIPANAITMGYTLRIIEEVAGSSSWRVRIGTYLDTHDIDTEAGTVLARSFSSFTSSPSAQSIAIVSLNNLFESGLVEFEFIILEIKTPPAP